MLALFHQASARALKFLHRRRAFFLKSARCPLRILCYGLIKVYKCIIYNKICSNQIKVYKYTVMFSSIQQLKYNCSCPFCKCCFYLFTPLSIKTMVTNVEGGFIRIFLFCFIVVVLVLLLYWVCQLRTSLTI